MKKMMMQLVFILMPMMSWAQFTISGKVTDAAIGEALPAANVVLERTGKAIATDATGMFVLSNVKSGSYQLKITFVGFKTWTKTIEVSQNVQLDVLMQPITIMADEVIVSATRASAKTPTTFTEVKRVDLQKQNLGQDIPFLLNQTPSVVVTSDAGSGVGYTGLRIRGSDATRINVTVNGIPLNDAESHGVFWVNMPDFASSVDNIQVQRGVGTSTNGAGAFGASINIQTTTLNQDAYTTVDNSYGSFNTRKHTVSAGTGLINDKFTVDARLSKISSDGYVDRAFSDLKSFFVSGGFYGKSSLIKVNVFSGAEQTYQSWNGLPEAALDTNRRWNYYTYDNETDNYQQDHYQLIYAQDIGDKLTLNTALHYTYGRGYYEQFRKDDEFEDYNLDPIVIRDSVISTTDLIRRRWLDNDFYGITSSLTYKLNDRLETVFGGGWNKYEGKHFGEIIWARFVSTSNIRDRYYENNATKEDFNLYWKTFYQVTTNFNVFADMQYRQIDYSFLGFDNDQDNVQQNDLLQFFNPKFGFTYIFNSKNRLYASYSIAHREPTRNDYTESTPESRPKPEQLRNLEVGCRRQFGNYFMNANYYLMDYKNQLVLTGQINDVGSYTRRNIGRSYRTGVEIEFGGNINEIFSVSANATLSHNKIRNFKEFIDLYDENWDYAGQTENEHGTTDIAFSPNIIAGGVFTIKPFVGLEISWFPKYVGEQYLDNTSSDSRRLDAFLVNDVRMIYGFKPQFMKRIELSLLVNNVFDVMYESNGYTFSYYAGDDLITENYYYPQAGVNFLAAVSLRF